MKMFLAEATVKKPSPSSSWVALALETLFCRRITRLLVGCPASGFVLVAYV